MTRKLLIFTILLCTVIFALSVDVDAFTFSDNNEAGYRVSEPSNAILNGGVKFYDDWGFTIKGTTEYSQHVNVLEMASDENSKLVTWAASDSYNAGFSRKTVANIAKDYEEKHPGWKVVGGMNADQYYTKYGEALGADGSDYFYPQPYYPMIADYEKWFSITATPRGNGNIVGITNDGSIDQLHYFNAGWNNTAANKAPISGLYLTIKGETEEKFLINKVNDNPGANESSLYSPYFTGSKIPDVEVSGSNLFVVEDAELAYMSNSTTYTYKQGNNENAFFGKGKVSKLATSATLKRGQFAINTNNQDLINALSVDDDIVVQYEFEGLLNTVESGIGFHTIMRMDGVDRTSTATYNTSLYPRAMLGRKADGTLSLVTVDGRQAGAGMNGVNMNESNAILKHYGVVEAYQLDGGGSVTMIIRDGNDFKTVNSPSDGSDRSVLNALLFVVKSPDIEEDLDIYEDKFTINVEINDPSVTKLFVKMGEDTKEVINGKVEFTDLTPNTEYNYEYWTYKDDVFVQTVLGGKINTAKRMPNVEYINIVNDDNGLIIEVNINDPDGASLRQNISFNGQSKLITKKQVEFPGVFDLNLETLSISISYDLNDGNGRQDVVFNDLKIRMNLVVYMMSTISKTKESVKEIYG